MEKVAAKKNDSLQVYRGLLCLNVVLLHAFSQLNTLYPLRILSVSVTPFFVMSGFLLMQKGDQEAEPFCLKDCLVSMWKRISRLYPLHVLTTLFIFSISAARLLYIGEFWAGIKPLLSPLFSHVFLLQSWIPKYQFVYNFNTPSWYISIAVFLYFIFPLLKNITIQASRRVGALALFFFILLIRFVWTGATTYFGEIHNWQFFPLWANYFCPFFRLAEFFMGCLAGFAYREKLHKINISDLQAAFLQVTTVFFGIFYFKIKSDSFPYLAQIFFKSQIVRLLLSTLWVYFFVEGKGLLRFIKVRPLVAFGNVSGFCYLIHWPVMDFQYALLNFLNVDSSSFSYSVVLIFVFAELIVSILLSFCWKILVEKLRKKDFK